MAHLLLERSVGAPDRLCLIAYDQAGVRRPYTYREFVRRVRQVAGYLAGLGVGRGDRVATILRNHHEAVFLMYAAWWLGAALVPVNVEEPPARKRFVLADAGACILFSLPEYLGEILPFRHELPGVRAIVAVEEGGLPLPVQRSDAPAPDNCLTSDALIVYTSGTTGNPKGVVLNQYNLLADADAISRWFSISPEERWLCVLPIHHVNGILVTLLSPLYAGAGVVLLWRFSPRTFWQAARAEEASVTSLVPTLLEFLMEGGEAQPHPLRGVLCGAGPLAVETVLRFEGRFGIPVWHGYGLSETTAYACMTPADLPAAERRRWYSEHGFPTIGTAMAHQKLSVRGADGAELGAGARGELCLQGSTIMQGYLRRPDANAEAFRFPGWFCSGDEGFWLEGPGGRPFFFITGRIKELIIRGGTNLSPLEIDGVLASHPAVRFGMAVPFENRWYGEEVAAYVLLRDGVPSSEALQAEILAYCAERLPFPMRPKVLLLGKEIPFTSTGKPKRLALKERLAELLRPYREVQFREGKQHGQ